MVEIGGAIGGRTSDLSKQAPGVGDPLQADLTGVPIEPEVLVYALDECELFRHTNMISQGCDR